MGIKMIEEIDFKFLLLYNASTFLLKRGEIIMKKILKAFIITVIFAVLAITTDAMAQDDMQEAKASFLGAGVKFRMDRPSMKARNLESMKSAEVKEALDYKNMDDGLLSSAFNGGRSGSGEGVRSRPIKDAKIICEVCKAKAVVNASENCEFCKNKPYADLCDKCIAWSILNSCDECKKNIRGKVAKKDEQKAEVKKEARETEKIEEPKVSEEIIADESEEAAKEVEKPAKKKKASKKSKAKKAAKKVETESVE